LPSPEPNVTFAVAALNEERLVDGFVREAHQQAGRILRDYEFILIDDGSTDRTGEIMDELAGSLPNTSVIHNPTNIGLGSSYMRGVQSARCDYYMLLCGDGGLPAESLPAIIEKVGTADMVLPYMTNLKALKSRGRYIISRSYTFLLNRLFGLDIRYYNGLPVHRTELVRGLGTISDGFGYQAEIIIKLTRAGFTYTQVAVLGAERSGGSRALRTRNIASVTRMITALLMRGFSAGK